MSCGRIIGFYIAFLRFVIINGSDKDFVLRNNRRAHVNVAADILNPVGLQG